MDDSRATSVAVVIPCFRQASFLGGATESVLAQSRAADEIIVVDDGGDEDLSRIVEGHPGVQLIRQENRGLAAARNLGLASATGDKIIFLDADDRLLPGAITAGLECFAANAGAAFVYGAHEEVREGSRRRCLTEASSRCDLVRFNTVGMIASAMFDRTALLAQGGFDESLGMCEDWDAYLRLSRGRDFAVHGAPVAEYLKHDRNMSNDVQSLRTWIEVVRERELARGLSPEEHRAWREGAAAWDAAYPQFTPVHLARRMARKIGRAARHVRG